MTGIEDDGLMTLVPLEGIEGKLYGTVMPFGTYDDNGVVLEGYLRRDIKAVVLLASDAECREKAGKDLRKLYAKKGMKVLYLPTPDYSVPDAKATTRTVEEALDLLRTGKNVAVHCSAGIGRTGLLIACLAGAALGFNGTKAYNWVRSHIPGAVESSEQREFIVRFLDEEKSEK